MKKILFVFYLLGSFFSSNLTPNTYVYDLPEGIVDINTFSENGVLTLVSSQGNGVDIYVDFENVDIDDRIGTLEQEWVVKEILNLKNGENEFDQSVSDVFKLNVDDNSTLSPVISIILMCKNDYMLEAYFVKPENLQGYSAFEDQILTVLSTIEKGDVSHEKTFFGYFDLLDSIDNGI
ncbi:hypothetical protein KKD70_03360 [Patescibacteria group bacterium]|nr:hypothetical protein [Patescibacteria group bacterium]